MIDWCCCQEKEKGDDKDKKGSTSHSDSHSNPSPEPEPTPEESYEKGTNILIDDIDVPVEIKADQPIQVEIDDSGTFQDIREI